MKTTNKKMNISLWLIIPQTNLHVGNESVVSLSVIDQAIQRDVVTGIPCINSSSLKGAIKEEMTMRAGEDDTKLSKLIQIFGSVKSNKNNTQKGRVLFFDASLLALPVQEINKLYSIKSNEHVLETFRQKLLSMGFNIGIDQLKGFLKSENNDLGYLSDKDFKDLVSDENLPIIARNCLENGESTNLWYEQVLPSKSILATFIVSPDEKDLAELDQQIVQIGANASIGYGYCKFIKYNQ